MAQFWYASDRIFQLAREGKDGEARTQIRLSLQARQAALSTAVARLLVQNNESEQRAGAQIKEIYDRVQRQVYLFLTATLSAIALTSIYIMRSNRRLFLQLEALSAQRSDLAQKLISTQESTLRYISRELHDEFGQILTAMGSMLRRAKNQLASDSPLQADLLELRGIAQNTLDKVRGLSQALHPVMLEEAGFESTLAWYLPMVEKQSRINICYEKSGVSAPVEGNTSIHVYRIVQEALNNVIRHSGATQAWVRVHFAADRLEVEVEDHGSGFTVPPGKHGIGLVAMRERAELVGGTIAFVPLSEGGTLVRLLVPYPRPASHV
jgi:signal transduction histidine kinase